VAFIVVSCVGCINKNTECKAFEKRLKFSESAVIEFLNENQ
jgi:hypothetical protein